MGPWRLPPVRWPALLLLVSVGLTTLGVVEANRAVRSQRAVAEHALRDYAGFAAWSYAQHLREALGSAMQEVIGAVNHGEGMHTSARIPDASELAHYIPWDSRCNCHRTRNGPGPAIFFGWKLGTDTVGVGVNTHRDPAAGWEVDRALPTPAPTEGRITGYTPDERRWLNDTLTRQIRRGRGNGRFTAVLATRDSLSRLLVYTLMPTVRGDTIVYGAEYSRAAVTAGLGDVMYERGLLPATFMHGRTVREVVQLRVTDAAGHLLFESEPVGEWRMDDSASLPAAFGSIRVRAQIRPSLAGSLVIGGLPRSRLPFLAGLLAVAAALSLVAIGQIRREAELARMRGDFVNSISHELRTPLAQMRLYLETLRLGRFETEAQRAWSLDNVERETMRLSQLVERVLRFSRVGGRDDESRAAVDAAAEAERIVEEFHPLAAARRARVVVETEPVPPLLLRPAALRHVLLNLLDNAVKYGPAGQTVRVRVAPAGGEVRIEVADEGPGVPAAERESVWRPYQRGGTAGHAAGSGIGLAIVRDVAAQHGGRAWIDEPGVGGRVPGAGGRGAVFVVAFPATGAIPPHDAADAETRAPDTGTPASEPAVR